MQMAFELDPQIIHHIIHSQAGSIGKAIIELLMNAVDARAASVTLSVTKDGFECVDDGTGFASREDVVRYFGRFGTPHAEGDATYGRFRLGRGQIMAHASTIWRSNAWQMTVDTRAMGYNYDLDQLADPRPGCSISGRWYDQLSDSEFMSVVQEIRDLVRYTPVAVELNGRSITRDPAANSGMPRTTSRGIASRPRAPYRSTTRACWCVMTPAICGVSVASSFRSRLSRSMFPEPRSCARPAPFGRQSPSASQRWRKGCAHVWVTIGRPNRVAKNRPARCWRAPRTS